MTRLIRLAKALSLAPVALSCVALFALMAMTFADVILRSALDAPIPAAPELTRIFMGILVFSVMPIVSARGEHITVDLTDGLFARAGLAHIRDGIVHIVSGMLLIRCVQRIWILAERARSYGDVTEFLAIPDFLMGWFIAAMTAMTAAVLIVTGVLHLVAPRLLEARP